MNNKPNYTALLRILVVLLLALVVMGLLSIPIFAQQPTGEIELRWDDPVVITGPLVLTSDEMTVSQYIYFEVRQAATVISSTSEYVGEGFDAAGAGFAMNVMYDFSLLPGEYDLFCGVRVDVEAELLAAGYSDDDLEVTDQRTFYGLYVEDGAVVPNDARGFAPCGSYVVEWLYYYFPIIFKQG